MTTAPVLLDPPVLHTFAAMQGRLFGSGEIRYGDLVYAIACICNHHARTKHDPEPAMQRALTTALRAAHADELLAAQDIRAGLQPLLRRRAPTAALRTEAYRLSAARLLRPDCDAIVNHEIAQALKARRGAR